MKTLKNITGLIIIILLCIGGILSTPSNAMAQDTPLFTLKAHIAYFKNDKGMVRLLLEDSRQNTVKTLVIAPQNKQLTVTFNDLPAGKYALSFFHDANENKELDAGLFGIPSEGWGCSNDARGFMSAPKFTDKLFLLNSNKEIYLKVVNY